MITSSERVSVTSPPDFKHIVLEPALLVATWFGSGLSPKAPGTVGSFAALPFIGVLLSFGSIWTALAAGVLLLVVGTWAAKRAGQAWAQVDHGAIVVDEVLGQLIALALPFYIGDQQTPTLAMTTLGFVFFRFFDITKLWPASYFDRHVKNALGVMLDDVAAGLWAGGFTWVVLYLWS